MKHSKLSVSFGSPLPNAANISPGIDDIHRNTGIQNRQDLLQIGVVNMLPVMAIYKSCICTGQQFKAALTTSFVLCVPLLLYEVFAFMKPGLTRKERTGIRFGLLFGVGFFALGAFFAYKVVLPFMLQFLIKQGQGTD